MSPGILRTGFYWDERCMWHGGGNYAAMAPVGGLVQPMASGGLPEAPEAKRRLKNLIEVTGLLDALDCRGADPATQAELQRVHPAGFLDEFRALSDAGGGEIGLRAPFGPGGFEIASRAAGLATQALRAVLSGAHRNAYALTRPPGHHCLPAWQNGFCLLNNIAIAVEAALAEKLCERVAILDWDVHHGNGTEAIFYDRPEVLTISLHQERNYPLDTGDAGHRGAGAGFGCNLNIPLPPGGGHQLYLDAMARIALPALDRFQPDIIIIACGYDAAGFDPLGRMLATVETFWEMTKQVMQAADALCAGRLMMTHEGGYSELYVPFCGHAVLAQMSGSEITAPDPFAETFAARQPSAALHAAHLALLDEIAGVFAN